MQKRRLVTFTTAATVVALGVLGLPAHAYHPGLNDVIQIGAWSIEFTDDNSWACTPPATPPPPGVPPPLPPFPVPSPNGEDRNFLPAAQALAILQGLNGPIPLPFLGPLDPDGYMQGYSDLGFNVPEPDDIAVSSFDCAPDGWHNDPDCDTASASESDGEMRFASTRFCSSAFDRNVGVAGHELFHFVQYGYLNSGTTPLDWGSVALEGSARMMEDHVFSFLDDGAGFSLYNAEVANYMSVPSQRFWWSSYQSALGWTYAAEQFGLSTAEPGRGVDFVLKFFENVDAYPPTTVDAPRVFEDTLKFFKPTATLETWFHDFTIANLAREYNVSALDQPSRYGYVDESDGTGVTYTSVTLNVSYLLPGPLGQTNVYMFPWSAAYFKALMGACEVGDLAGFKANVTDAGGGLKLGGPLRFAIVPAQSVGGPKKAALGIVRGRADEFAAAFVRRQDELNEIGAVVTSTSGGRRFDYVFDCGPGALEIGFPKDNYVAYVGDFNNTPQRLMTVAVRVTGPSSLSLPTVRGLQARDFTVYVGSSNTAVDLASIKGFNEVGDSYFLSVEPPGGKSSAGPFDLHVNLGPSISNTSANAVRYEDRVLDQVITTDISGSMAFAGVPGGQAKIASAISAGQMLVNTAFAGDQIGAVKFAETASVLPSSGLDLANDAHRLDVGDDIQDLVPLLLNGTSIGAGALSATNEIIANGTSLGENWIVLLTDGDQNSLPFWSTVEPAVIAAGVSVAALALGDDANNNLLQTIADKTNGFFWAVDAQDGGALQSGPAQGGPVAQGVGPGSDPVPNALADAYLLSNEVATGSERLWEVEASLTQGSAANYVIQVDEGGIGEATLAFHRNDRNDVLTVQVTRPDSSVVTHGVAGAKIYTGNSHRVFHVGDMMQGTWTISATATTGDVDFIGVLAGRDEQAASMKVRLGQVHDDASHAAVGIRYLWGLPQPISAALNDRNGAIVGASVTAYVTHPDGTFLILPLFDDSEHGDGGPDDGVYANLYTRSTGRNIYPSVGSAGTYRVVALATGTNGLGQNFARIRKKAFVVSELNDPPPDSDGDSMPDRYERLHHCLDENVPNEGDDADLDTLVASNEWQIGTDACHPDSDHGGESDGSEVARSANPFDPADDALPEPIDPEVVDWVFEHIQFAPPVALNPNANLIRYPRHTSYNQMRIWRSMSMAGPFSIIATLSGPTLTGLYEDAGLVNGTTYYYMVQPIDVGGNIGAHSLIFEGKPSSDPIPPIGDVTINSGAAYAASTSASLHLVAPGNTDEMLISNLPTFAGSSWQTYNYTLPWTLVPNPATGIATVHARFRKLTGRESPSTYTDSIEVVTASAMGAVEGIVTLQDLTNFAGVSISASDDPSLVPIVTAASGKFHMALIPPGTYKITLSRGGYNDVVIENVVVVAGQETNLGTIAMTLNVPVPVLGPAMWLVFGLALVLGIGRIVRPGPGGRKGMKAAMPS